MQPARRVGVGQPRPQYVSAYGTDDWLDILQGTGPGNRHRQLASACRFPARKAGAARRWSKNCASSGTRPETIRHARKSMFGRPCRTSLAGSGRVLVIRSFKHGSIGYRRHGNEHNDRNHAGNHDPH